MQKVRGELRTVFTLGSFARIILVSLALAVGIWYWTEKALGPLEFNWIRSIVISVFMGIAVLFMGAASTCVPPTIRISAKGITVVKAQQSFTVPFSDLVGISIQASGTPTLTFRKADRAHHYAIAQSLDLNRLRQELERLSGRLVEIETAGQPDGAANGNQPIRSETNRTPSAAGSRR
jgi:hypothetical protein